MAVAMLAALVAGCGAEHQEPVAMKPGLYLVDTGGNGVLFLKNGELEMQRCLSAGDLAALIRDPLGNVAYPWKRCREAPAETRGNAMSGERICGPDDQGRPWAHIEFSGSHTQDSFTLEGHSSHPGESFGMTDFRSGDFLITGKRTAAC
jgi:hypothetical protein